MSQGLCKAGLENQINLYRAYGMSETCPLPTVANLKPHMQTWDADRQVEMRCRTGLPVPNVLLEVVDTQGNPLPHDGKTAGEVVVRSPWLTQGYVEDAEKSVALWADGWLHTGDIGFIDQIRYYKNEGRFPFMGNPAFSSGDQAYANAFAAELFKMADDGIGERIVVLLEKGNQLFGHVLERFDLLFLHHRLNGLHALFDLAQTFGDPDDILFFHDGLLPCTMAVGQCRIQIEPVYSLCSPVTSHFSTQSGMSTNPSGPPARRYRRQRIFMVVGLGKAGATGQ